MNDSPFTDEIPRSPEFNPDHWKLFKGSECKYSPLSLWGGGILSTTP